MTDREQNLRKEDLTCPWHGETEGAACAAQKKAERALQASGRLPTTRALIAIILVAISLVGGVSGAIYGSSQARIKAVEDKVSQSQKNVLVIMEALKRIEDKQDMLIRYQEKRDDRIDNRLDDMEHRLRQIEHGPTNR